MQIEALVCDMAGLFCNQDGSGCVYRQVAIEEDVVLNRSFSSVFGKKMSVANGYLLDFTL